MVIYGFDDTTDWDQSTYLIWDPAHGKRQLKATQWQKIPTPAASSSHGRAPTSNRWLISGRRTRSASRWCSRQDGGGALRAEPR